MSRGKKAAILIVVSVLLITVLWMYWEREISMMDVLPDASLNQGPAPGGRAGQPGTGTRIHLAAAGRDPGCR